MEPIDFSSEEDNVKKLKTKIIAEITEKPSYTYELATLFGHDAAECFPIPCSWAWDGAWFKLNLKTGKLFVELNTYPNQFGACREDSYRLKASEFHEIAVKYNMSPELQAFESDADWEKLFDDEFKDIVSSVFSKKEKQDEDRKKEAAEKNAVKIPPRYAVLSPKMDIPEVYIEVDQAYANHSMKVSITNNKYKIYYTWKSHMSSDVKMHSRELTTTEAVWFENQVKNTVNNSDNSTWQSLDGRSTMTVLIKQSGSRQINYKRTEPINKYYDLKHKLENLAEYGSILSN